MFFRFLRGNVITRRLQFMCTVLLALIAMVCGGVAARADAYADYIAQYADMAVNQQNESGIPASITLAQGLLESAAGRSTLATKANNHFGIKCHADWKGDTIIRSDDRPDDCFRVYRNVEESFRDHANFLKRKRYASLFELAVTDYSGWAYGLSRCGYATDPNYAPRLIAIIERYALYLYDSEAGREAEENTDFIMNTLLASHPVRRFRKLHYVIAAPGDTYADIAREFKIDKKKLLQYNDRKRDGKIKEWEEVYLEPKHDAAPDAADAPARVAIGDRESIHSISQRFGVKLATLQRLNPDTPDKPGQILRLR